MNTLYIGIVLVIFALGLAGLGFLQYRNWSFTKRVLLAMGGGVLVGGVTHLVFGVDADVTKSATDWISIVGDGYISLLQLLVIPLVFVAVVSAFTKMTESKNLRKISGATLTVLLSTTAVAAFVGYVAVLISGLAGAEFTEGAAESKRIEALVAKQESLTNLTLPQQIVSFIPTNFFKDLTNARSASTLGVVIFAILVGIAYIALRRSETTAKSAEFFANFISSLHDIIIQLVRFVIKLTPYGVLALITTVLATSDFVAILHLGSFVLTSYVAIIVMFLVHFAILFFFKVTPLQYLRGAWAALSFAFFSRSSAGTLPINVEVQQSKFGVDEASANFSASFGLSIGQNGCAGIYPAMLATIIAPTVGIDVLSWQFAFSLIAIVTISSFGVAGVGGGATFASLIVLGILGLPVTIIGLVVSVEPLIDMARTALNVSDAIVAGIVSSSVTGERSRPVDQLESFNNSGK
jgi:L-cystine uptake protein TcyP (sodium:dicarboxylate symporter family)